MRTPEARVQCALAVVALLNKHTLRAIVRHRVQHQNSNAPTRVLRGVHAAIRKSLCGVNHNRMVYAKTSLSTSLELNELRLHEWAASARCAHRTMTKCAKLPACIAHSNADVTNRTEPKARAALLAECGAAGVVVMCYKQNVARSIAISHARCEREERRSSQEAKVAQRIRHIFNADAIAWLPLSAIVIALRSVEMRLHLRLC